MTKSFDARAEYRPPKNPLVRWLVVALLGFCLACQSGELVQTGANGEPITSTPPASASGSETSDVENEPVLWIVTRETDVYFCPGFGNNPLDIGRCAVDNKQPLYTLPEGTIVRDGNKRDLMWIRIYYPGAQGWVPGWVPRSALERK